MHFQLLAAKNCLLPIIGISLHKASSRKKVIPDFLMAQKIRGYMIDLTVIPIDWKMKANSSSENQPVRVCLRLLPAW